jgi:transposase InsO family protein
MYPLIDHTVSPSVSKQELCRLAQVPRATYYRHRDGVTLKDRSDPLVGTIHTICAQYPRYGYRRVTRELQRHAYPVNHKRILRIMRTEKLLCKPKRRFVRTTDSRHGLPVYPNLVPGMSITGPDQLWVADITYIALGSQSFVYVAVILDAWSRRVIGWAVSTHIDTHLSLAALRMALATRSVTLPGLVHHSDRGVQYASTDYIALLTSRNIAVSMSRKGNPYDNAKAESFMKTLKAEEVSLNEYRSLLDVCAGIEQYIESVYNAQRLHSSLGYKPPIEFEADFYNSLNQEISTLSPDFTVSL